MSIETVLLEELQAVCPVVSVKVPDPKVKDSWVINFHPDATEAEKARALNAVLKFPSNRLVLSRWGERTRKLDQAIREICPSTGVSIGKVNDKDTWRVDFLPEANASQKAAARAFIKAFDILEKDAVVHPLDEDPRIMALSKVMAQWAGKTPEELKAAFEENYEPR